MPAEFSRILSSLRTEKGLSQRTAAANLRISQALLSHYENGVREPGLVFVCRACDYYDVSADYILGRTENRQGSAGERDRAALTELAEQLRSLADHIEEL